jgi:hypothetical protein
MRPKGGPKKLALACHILFKNNGPSWDGEMQKPTAEEIRLAVKLHDDFLRCRRP